MSVDYWLGVLTLPAVALAVFLAFVAYVRGTAALDARWGISFELKLHRDVEGISDYMLRRDVWWERAFGPVFAGGWYREPPTYNEPTRRLATRWIGVGRTDGPCWMAYRKRNLGSVEPRLAVCRRCKETLVWDEGNGGQWLGATPPRDWMACFGRPDGPPHEPRLGPGA